MILINKSKALQSVLLLAGSLLFSSLVNAAADRGLLPPKAGVVTQQLVLSPDGTTVARVRWSAGFPRYVEYRSLTSEGGWIRVKSVRRPENIGFDASGQHLLVASWDYQSIDREKAMALFKVSLDDTQAKTIIHQARFLGLPQGIENDDVFIKLKRPKPDTPHTSNFYWVQIRPNGRVVEIVPDNVFNERESPTLIDGGVFMSVPSLAKGVNEQIALFSFEGRKAIVSDASLFASHGYDLTCDYLVRRCMTTVGKGDRIYSAFRIRIFIDGKTCESPEFIGRSEDLRISRNGKVAVFLHKENERVEDWSIKHFDFSEKKCLPMSIVTIK